MFSACAPVPPADRLTLAPVTFADLPGWQHDNQAAALPALAGSCMRLAAKPAWQTACAALDAVPPDDAAARTYFETYFTPMRAGNNDDPDGLFTGYYEPSLAGSLRQQGIYQTPVYARPDDLVTVDLGLFRDSLKGQKIVGRVATGALVPYPDRAAIAATGLQNQARVLFWAADPVDAFFLEVQGSGRVELDDGNVLRVGYAAQNGHGYVAIGRELKAAGVFGADEKVTMQKIRTWLAAHPDAVQETLNRNPSYVFFQPRDAKDTADGPIGAAGLPLTPQRSLAVDPKFVGYGTPLWLDVAAPGSEDGEDEAGARLQQLVIAQDTGGAIKGPVRGDLFWGHGPEAEAGAGKMQSRGGYYLLQPKATDN